MSGAAAVAAAIEISQLAVIGTSLFIGEAPVMVEDVVVVIEYAGLGPLRVYGNHSQGIDRSRVQVLVRRKAAAAADLLAWEIYRALDRMRNAGLPGARIVAIEALGTPAFLGRDDRGFAQYVCNYEVGVAREGS